jgi:hypothetical protein
MQARGAAATVFVTAARPAVTEWIGREGASDSATPFGDRRARMPAGQR